MSRLPLPLSLLVVAMVAILLAACNGGGGGGGDQEDTPTPEEDAGPPEARSVEVSALAVSASPDACTEDPSTGSIIVDPFVDGVLLPVTITVTPSEKDQPSVSFTETEVGAAGDQWTAAGWTAVSVASLLTGVDPTRYDFNFAVSGPIDGPSAGGLLTVGVMAAILGDDVRDDAAMTGTIAPDGTIGPVGGIPQKIAGAAEGAEGAEPAEIVFVPGSQATDLDLSDCTFVQVEDVGDANGIEVQRVDNIYEAYEALTGKPLPRPEGGSAATLPSSASDRLASLADARLGRFLQAVDRFNSLPADIRSFYQADIDAASFDADRALGFLDEGRAAAGYELALSAAVAAESVVETANLDNVYLEQGPGPLIDQLNALAGVSAQLSAALDRLESETPQTMNDVLTLIDAYSNLVVADGAVFQGDLIIDDINALIDEIIAGTISIEEGEAALVDLIFLAAFHYINADFFVEAAENNLDYGLGFGSAAPPSDRALRGMSATLEQAAQANLAFLDTLGDFSGDTNYTTAFLALDLIPLLEDELQEPHLSMATLGAGLTAWATSSLIVVEEYSLGVEVDEFGNIVRFLREGAVTEALDFASDRAEELLGVVAEEEPVSAIYYHEVARSYREGDAQDKATALFYDWQATALAQMVAYFNGHYDDAINAEPAGDSPLWRWGGRAALDAAESSSDEDNPEGSPEADE